MYGSEAMTPHELKHGSPRTNPNVIPDIDELTRKDLLDEDHVDAIEELNKYQAQMKAWKEKTVTPKEFEEGDLVLIITNRTESKGKIEPKWEGPFIIKKKTSPNAYSIATQTGEDLEYTWNIDNLRKFYL
jgi:ribosomal protein L21E